ncbi:LysE family translocator [Comamonas flocculans]|uniref:LysE family translocator n=1 Tax=Comamonas flocculans TaxID=2597701 RepID=A0A5B8RSD0_9BURK|nr:LysE family transporter [Comamonas flocculans]QEA12446.1 LysE family translocator [Comamonas flocculans]
MSLNTWLIYLLASIGLSLSPGPNGLLALTHGAMYGQRRTLFTIAGGVLGFVAVIALSMFGIGALIRTSAQWLTVLKWGGGLYLVWLGIQVWRAPPVTLVERSQSGPGSARRMFGQGVLSATTNPKALLFFTAFLPQFMNAEHSLLLQFAILAGTFAATELLTEYLLASAAQRISPWLARAGRRFNRACGGVFMALGALLPLRG